MLSVKGIYENGQVKLLEDIPHTKKAKLIVIVLEEEELSDVELDTSLFDDLVGVVAIREDGSTNHDKYIAKKN